MNDGFSEDDVKKVAGGAGAFLAGGIIGGGLLYVAELILAAYLGAEAFGLYALGFAVVKVLDIFARMGLNTGGMRYVSIFKDSDPGRLKGVLLTSTGISLMNGLFFAVVMFACSEIVANRVFNNPEMAPALRMFALGIPLVAGVMVVSFLFQGFQSSKYAAYVRFFIHPPLNIILILIFLAAGMGLAGAVLAFLLSNLAAFLFGIFRIRNFSPGLKDRAVKPVYEVRTLLAYSAPLLMIGFLHYLLTYMNVLFLGVMGNAADAGVFRAASLLPLTMPLFLTATNSIYAPLAAELHQKNETHRMFSVFRTTTRWTIFASVPVFLVLVFSANEIMALFGNQYAQQGCTVLIVLAAGQLINTATGGVGYTLTMTKRQNIELANSIGLVILNAVLNLILIPIHGVMGAAIAAGVSIGIINLLRLVEVYVIFRMTPYSFHLLKLVAPTVICISALLLLDVGLTGIFRLIFNTVFVSAVFTISLLVFKPTDEDRFLMDIVRKKLVSKRGTQTH